MTAFLPVIFLFSLGLGTTITFASSHWVLAWMGLEINTLSILPLMANSHHPRAIEAATKYFLTQATAATTMLFAGISNAWITGQWDILQMSHPVPTTLAILALSMKMGLAPFHYWLPEVLQGLNLTTALILSTWQKLAPFILLIQMTPTHPNILMWLGLLSILIGSWGGLGQLQLRKILAYSSIAHLGWTAVVMQFSVQISLLILLTYMIMTSAMFLMFNFNKATNFGALTISWTKAPTLASLAPLVFLSLGGLPPLTGFAPKWLAIQELTTQGQVLVSLLAALAALIGLYFYLRLARTMSMTFSPNNPSGMTPWRLPVVQQTLPLAISVIASTSLLPLTPMIVAMIS
uniref:NADH-ubiquinone oxidoreductase chain 2 n=1 Tax=Heniochus chrysostomus TaxID=109925 RepID=A0A7U0FQU0_HENCH|nr:NADH dehydrogenase subunit 2 [Heniochus chrysostomus]QQV70742.1 NADH dehydrogenase subunit 2 [Heniochus chrysostomus]